MRPKTGVIVEWLGRGWSGERRFWMSMLDRRFWLVSFVLDLLCPINLSLLYSLYHNFFFRSIASPFNGILTSWFSFYTEGLLSGVVTIPNNVIYRFLTCMWLNFRWAFFLHDSTSLIVRINFLSTFAIIYSIRYRLAANPYYAQENYWK